VRGIAEVHQEGLPDRDVPVPCPCGKARQIDLLVGSGIRRDAQARADLERGRALARLGSIAVHAGASRPVWLARQARLRTIPAAARLATTVQEGVLHPTSSLNPVSGSAKSAGPVTALVQTGS